MLHVEACVQEDVPQPPDEEIAAMQEMMMRQAAAMEKHSRGRQRAQQEAQAAQQAQQAKVPPCTSNLCCRLNKLSRLRCHVALGIRIACSACPAALTGQGATLHFKSVLQAQYAQQA
jgi:hypothetical protein